MRFLKLAILILVPVMTLLPACGSIGTSFNKGRVINNPLTEDEMAEPSGRYQYRADMGHTGQVHLAPPTDEPVVQWSIAVKNQYRSISTMVDSEGCTWYTHIPTLGLPAMIVRVNPDGSTVFENEMPGVYLPILVLECRNAVISQSKLIKPEDSSEVRTMAIEAIDFDGNLRWRTAPVDDPGVTKEGIWRFSNDRIIDLQSYPDTFNIYTLSDGDLLETWTIPDLSFSSTHGPLEMSDGGIIGRSRNDSITRFTSDHSVMWEHSLNSGSLESPVLTQEGILVVGSRNLIEGLDVETGEVLWVKEEEAMMYPIGLTLDNNTIAVATTGNRRIMALDSNGNEIWSHPEPDFVLPMGSEVMIYNDNSVLYGSRAGITLLNPDGTLCWSLDRTDLGFPPDARLNSWNLNPSPDGRIVACMFWEDWPDSIIISLGPPD